MLDIRLCSMNYSRANSEACDKVQKSVVSFILEHTPTKAQSVYEIIYNRLTRDFERSVIKKIYIKINVVADNYVVTQKSQKIRKYIRYCGRIGKHFVCYSCKVSDKFADGKRRLDKGGKAIYLFI